MAKTGICNQINFDKNYIHDEKDLQKHKMSLTPSIKCYDTDQPLNPTPSSAGMPQKEIPCSQPSSQPLRQNDCSIQLRLISNKTLAAIIQSNNNILPKFRKTWYQKGKQHRRI